MKYRKILVAGSVAVATLLLLMVILPFLFSGTITEKAKNLVNGSINGKMNFSKVDISFFKHFPNLTVTIYDFSLMGSEPFSEDTLASGKEISLGVNLLSVLSKNIKINKVYIDGASFNILMGENGANNYDIIKTGPEPATVDTTGAGAAFSIDVIRITKSNFRFYDSTSKLLIEAKNFKYKGAGEFSSDQFDLVSDFKTGSFSFSYDGVTYVDQKDVVARLETGINTSTLNFKLRKNDVRLEDVTAVFTGNLTILDNGYDIDLNLKTEKSDFGDLFSLLPHEYTDWFANTTITGKSLLSVKFNGSARDSLNIDPDFGMNIEVSDGKIACADAPYPLEKIFVKSSLLIPGLNPDSLEIKVDKLSFSLQGKENSAKLFYKGLDKPSLTADAKGSLDLGVLTESLGFKSLKLGGKLDYRAVVNGVINLSERSLPVIDAEVRLTDGLISTSKYPNSIKDLNADVKVSTPSGKYSDINVVIDPFSFSFEDKPFSIIARLKNFDDLQYDIVSKGDLNLDNIYQVFALSGISIKGEFLTDLKLLGTQSDARNGRYQKLDNSGTLELKNFEFKSDKYKYPFRIPDAVLNIDKDKAWMRNATVDYNENSFSLDGYAQNFMGYYFEGGDLKGRLSVKAQQVVLDDFLSMMETGESDTTSIAASTGVIQIPNNLDLALRADARNILYDGIKASDFKGEVAIKDGALQVKNTRVKMAGARFNLEAGYKPTGNDKADFNFTAKADSFDIRRAYNEIPMFKELVSAAANIQGLVSTEYTIKGKLNQNMEPVYPSIKGKGFIRLEDVKVKGLKILGAVSKATGKDSINNPHLKSVLIKTTIANNIIKIERTKMRIFGFRPRFEGETSLDGKLNLNFRLGLPPLGIFGIPMTITGTFDNPKVNMRRGKAGDKLEEDIDESEEL